MRSAVVTIPKILRSREKARGLVRGSVRPNINTVAINAFAEEHVTIGAADEIVEQLMDVGVELVVVVGASDKFREHLTKSHDWRATTERTFLMQFRTQPEDVLLRAV